ncbi:MAG: cytochrome-c oxidase, cbb3-type subunit II [Longimicrobiales bacterium]|nr:cytochrome-c oxidase, cbb3-type subunit II [Longimicrobiales bacterium]
MSENETRHDTTPAGETPSGVSESAYGAWHRRVLEGRAGLFAVATAVAISIGGLVEIVPMFTATDMGVGEDMPITPYTPLEVAGRDLYVREGCYLCHSQMVRPMRSEVLRYGEWSRAWEYRYDRPFLLGSRRLGPDLHRIGGKYPDAWHYEHMRDPRSTSPGSIMPAYSWMLERTVDPEVVTKSLRALQKVGHPYVDVTEENVRGSMEAQGRRIVENLRSTGIESRWDTEIVAMIAYLQRLGSDGKAVLSGGSREE